MSRPADRLGRPLRDLRISVTDRCNFRCTFCMPEDREYEYVPRSEVLDYEEIARLVGQFARAGVRKVRLTGGEPLLRRDLDRLIAQLAAIEGIDDVALTTNGVLLPQRAEALAEAGLDRVTVSLHSLNEETFGRLTARRGRVQDVLAGIEAARSAGLTPIKINAVVIRGVNDDEVVDLARRFASSDTVLRFIEFMDVGTVNDWRPEGVVSAREIVERIGGVLPLAPIERERPSDVAERYRYLDGSGEVGIITSITQPFCGDCARARLSCEGELFTCLFSASGHDLKTLLRAGASDDELLARIAEIWNGRTDRYSEERAEQLARGQSPTQGRVEMFRIGG